MERVVYPADLDQFLEWLSRSAAMLPVAGRFDAVVEAIIRPHHHVLIIARHDRSKAGVRNPPLWFVFGRNLSLVIGYEGQPTVPSRPSSTTHVPKSVSRHLRREFDVGHASVQSAVIFMVGIVKLPGHFA